jgi:hypothetical protein
MPFEPNKIPPGSKPFKKGQSGNPKGRPKKIPDLMVLLANVLGDTKNDLTAAEHILNALRKKALAGDVRAAEMLLDRAYGKPKQPTENTTDLNIKLPAIKIIDTSKNSEVE